MTGTVTTPRMTAGEIRLMRAVVRWRREMGIDFIASAALWREPVVGGHAVSYDPPFSHLGISHHGKAWQWITVGSVTEAVDILVAKGFLPARFSSAFRAGWDGALRFMAAPEYDPETYKPDRLPVHEVAW